MSCFSRTASQARLGFVLENNGSKYCQVVDDFPSLPMGVWRENATFWTAVWEGGNLPYNKNVCSGSAFTGRLHLSGAMRTDSGCMKASLVAIYLF